MTVLQTSTPTPPRLMGSMRRAALVEKAAAAGIQVLAVTDHDTIDGAEEAVRRARPWALQCCAAWSWGRPRTGTCTYSACTSARSAPP